ncbi:hypothetical protein VC83_08590 [Pseudogymnoascus destructans]|uniref:Uncharacterized protein n=1 Tax=Pseudogymnoascus destructans TaxID=655981 RepID=A0A176ZY87_9PEZI|nr:uncharacterized protein VC83_08590 [Pseudogymnoascus destructans]OAF54969.1 hypothetical protein VC83_08590 [Pseudogymnoascus destructans]
MPHNVHEMSNLPIPEPNSTPTENPTAAAVPSQGCAANINRYLLAEFAGDVLLARSIIGLQGIRSAYTSSAKRFFGPRAQNDIASDDTRSDFIYFTSLYKTTYYGETVHIADFAAAVEMRGYIKIQFDIDFDVEVLIMTRAILLSIYKKCMLGVLSLAEDIDYIFKIGRLLDVGKNTIRMHGTHCLDLRPIIRLSSASVLVELGIPANDHLLDAVDWCMIAIDEHGSEEFLYDLLVAMGLVDADTSGFADRLAL